VLADRDRAVGALSRVGSGAAVAHSGGCGKRMTHDTYDRLGRGEGDRCCPPRPSVNDL
jgi:hypothetical protein